MIFRFLTSGESHGKCLNAIIEGVPSGVSINKDFINKELSRRQVGYGRGGNDATAATLDVDEDGRLTASIIPV